MQGVNTQEESRKATSTHELVDCKRNVRTEEDEDFYWNEIFFKIERESERLFLVWIILKAF